MGQREIVITVESTREWAICASCGKEIREFHGYGLQLRLRHLPILGRQVFIEIRPKRFRCPTCDNHPTTTQKLNWYSERSLRTAAYGQWLQLQLIGSTVSDLARKEKSVSESGLGCFDSFLTTLENWMDEITNFFINRQTSGFVDGFNNKVKVLKRRCYGITILRHLFQRLYLDLEGYRLFVL
jgi:transposase